MFRALLCLVRLHCPPPGLREDLSIYWHCERCGTRVAGALGVKR